MIFNRNNLKGMSLTTLLLTVLIFSGIFLSINQWTARQRQIGMETYLRYQALQIAENQKQRQFLGLPCENMIVQNQLGFEVQCARDKVTVRYFFRKKTLEL